MTSDDFSFFLSFLRYLSLFFLFDLAVMESHADSGWGSDMFNGFGSSLSEGGIGVE